jgi:1-acyl-sn-glycerol-3-phosphate acyltransferase
MRRWLRWISARCLRWVYRDQLVLHAERVPTAGPVLLIGNHPNDLPDVLLGYVISPRPLRYLATVSAATDWLTRKSYEWHGVIPVARLRDARTLKAAGVDAMAINRRAGDTVSVALASGGIVGAFPEGGVRDHGALSDFKTGVALMALNYLDSAPENDVMIVPFGIQYEAPRTPGSDVVTVVGEPFSLRRWRESQPPEHRSVGALTRAMHAAVRAVTRNAPDWDAAERRDRIVAAVAAGVHPRTPLAAAPAIARALDALHAPAPVEDAPAPAAAPAIAAAPTPAPDALGVASRQLADAVHRAGGIPTSALDHARLLFALDVTTQPAPVPTVALCLGAPAAVIGWAVHGPLFVVIWALAGRLAKVRTDLIVRCYVPGMFVIVLGYLVVALAMMIGAFFAHMSLLWCIPIVMLLPKLGDLAVAWRNGYRMWRLAARARGWSNAERVALRAAAATVQREWAARAAGAGRPPDATPSPCDTAASVSGAD